MVVHFHRRGNLKIGERILRGFQADPDSETLSESFVTVPKSWDLGLDPVSVNMVTGTFPSVEGDPADLTVFANALLKGGGYTPEEALAAVRLAHR